MAKKKKAPKMTIGRAALVGLMRRYLSAVMDPAVLLLEIHKLMYFMQEAGEPLKLTQQRPMALMLKICATFSAPSKAISSAVMARPKTIRANRSN